MNALQDLESLMGEFIRIMQFFPDICIYGKALGNGYPINAIVGKKNIMENASNSFISTHILDRRIGTNGSY